MAGLDGKRVFILCAKPVPDAGQGGDQMHTGDLDKVQPPSTCYVTNEINLEPAVCCADISETFKDC